MRVERVGIWNYALDRQEPLNWKASIGKGRPRSLLLMPIKSLAAMPFTFPFSSRSKITEALNAKASVFAHGGGIRIAVGSISKKDKGYSGVALIVPELEMEALEGKKVHNVWPLAMVGCGAVEGHGASIVKYDDSITTMHFSDGKPVLYRWQSATRRTLEEEIAWSSGIIGDDNLFVASSDDEDFDLTLGGALAATLEGFPGLLDYDLSARGVNRVMLMDSLQKMAMMASVWLLVGAGLFTFLEIMNYRISAMEYSGIVAESERVYRETFNERGPVNDPLSQARSKFSALSSAPDYPTLEDSLAKIGRIWMKDSDLVLDQLRYTQDSGIELNGNAQQIPSVQELQRLLRTQDFNVRVGDYQTLPNNSLRFSMNLRWTE